MAKHSKKQLARIIGDVLADWYRAGVIKSIDEDSYARARDLVHRCLEHEEG